MVEEDQTSITILCGHTFHFKCLRDWTDQTCPVCRYQQHPSELIFCQACDVHEELWCCIVCGYVGCGGSLPMEGHSLEHAQQSSHIYAKMLNKDVGR